MILQLFPGLLCIYILAQSANALIHLEVNPSHITPGLTSSLTVNCTFSYANLSSVSSILSLIVSKAEIQNNVAQAFVEVVSLSAFTPDQVNELVNLGATVTGQIDADSESCLSLQWTYPSEDLSGVYRCDANVLDNIGHPVSLTSISNQVTWSKPAIDELIETVKSLKSENERQQKKQEDLMAKAFYISSEYQDHIYLLSKHHTKRIDVAEASCEHYGGHLVELDDAPEHEFVKSFLQPLSSVSLVLVGASDEVSEGNWIFRFSENPLVYTDWNSGEPNAPDNDCAVISKSYSWRMFDYHCYDFTSNIIHYLCEVPQPR